jgi:hypothetical protein
MIQLFWSAAYSAHRPSHAASGTACCSPIGSTYVTSVVVEPALGIVKNTKCWWSEMGRVILCLRLLTCSVADVADEPDCHGCDL